MYMLVQPEWIGDMQCDAARHVNPLNLFVHNPYNSPLLNEKEGKLIKHNTYAYMRSRVLRVPQRNRQKFEVMHQHHFQPYKQRLQET